jgi:CheY-like chemotaxis protein
MLTGMSTQPQTALDHWVVLIVDDDKGVHDVTNITLRNFKPYGKSLEILNAYSAEEAKKILESRQDIALVFLDVVMETNDAGLKLVNFIRNVLNNHSIRIIIRTGMPGDFPEASILVDYDINEYWEKTAFTSRKIHSTILAGLRNYRDIRQMKGAQIALRKMIYQLPSDFANLELKEVTKQFFVTLSTLFQDLWEPKNFYRGQLIGLNKGKLDILGGWNKDLSGFGTIFSPDEQKLIEGSLTDLKYRSQGEFFLFPFKDWLGNRLLIYLRWEEPPIDLQTEITKVAVYQFTRWVNNKSVLNALEKEKDRLAGSLEEKNSLLREIHHRVKNNLQLLSSILNISKGNHGELSRESYDEAQLRILSVAIIHDHIYRTGSVEELRVQPYIRTLFPEARQQNQVHDALVLELPEKAIHLDLRQGIPFGLLMMELFSLSSKQIESPPPKLSLELDNKDLVLRGEGFYELEARGAKLNTELIEILANQLGGTNRLNRGEVQIQWSIVS